MNLILDRAAIAERHAELLSLMIGEARESDAYRSLDDNEGQLLLIDADGYHLTYVERGQESRRRSTRDVDELLFWFLEQTAFSIGCAHEFANRVEGADFRRMVHAKQRELFVRLDFQWRARLEENITAILSVHPYLDSSPS